MALPPRGVEDAGVFEQAHGGIVLIREPLGKGTEATRQEFGQVVVHLAIRTEFREGRILLVGEPPLNGAYDWKGQPEYPGEHIRVHVAVGLLGAADVFSQFEQRGFIKQRFGGGQAQLCRGGQGGLRLPGCLPLCPVVPEGVVAFVLVEADTVAEFGAYLVGVDAGEEGGELADGHAEGVLYAGCSRCFDHRNTPSFPVGIELDGLSRPSQPHALNNWTHGGVWFALVGDDENG